MAKRGLFDRLYEATSSLGLCWVFTQLTSVITRFDLVVPSFTASFRVILVLQGFFKVMWSVELILLGFK